MDFIYNRQRKSTKMLIRWDKPTQQIYLYRTEIELNQENLKWLPKLLAVLMLRRNPEDMTDHVIVINMTIQNVWRGCVCVFNECYNCRTSYLCLCVSWLWSCHWSPGCVGSQQHWLSLEEGCHCQQWIPSLRGQEVWRRGAGGDGQNRKRVDINRTRCVYDGDKKFPWEYIYCI